MISFYSETDFILDSQSEVSKWITRVISDLGYKEGDISYIFGDDQYLMERNVKYLKHNTLTDIISFDYTIGKLLSGDIFISVERVKDNALDFDTIFIDELHRVMIHGVLHFCGYKDKTNDEKSVMREAEDYCLTLRTF